MLKSIAINNLLSLTKKNKKRFRILTNIAISFVVAAIITSFISIYYESKLTNLRAELTKLNYDKSITQEWLSDNSKLLSRNRHYDFLYTLSASLPKDYLNLSAERFYYNMLAWTPETVRLAIADAKRLNLNVELISKEELNSLKSRYLRASKSQRDQNYFKEYALKNFTIEEMDNITEKIRDNVSKIGNNLFYYEGPNRENIISDENYFQDIDINFLQNQIFSLEAITTILTVMYSNKNNSISEKLKKIEREILLATKYSTNIILFAFLFQIIIFIIIQIFEVREVK